MIFPRVLQNSPERHIKVRDPLQIPVIKRILPEMPYLLAVDSKRILLGPGDQTVRIDVYKRQRVRIPKIKAVEKSRLWDLSVE